MDALAEKYRSIAVQLPLDRKGDRRSDGVRSISELTATVDRALERARIDQPIVLVGNSLGGLRAIDDTLQDLLRSSIGNR